MNKIWLQSYQEGVPGEIDLNEFESLGDMFEKSVAKYRDKVAYVNMGVELTYGEIDQLSRDFAAYLQSVLKLPRGARLAIMMPNVLQYPICMFGALRAGYTVVNVNPLYTPRTGTPAQGFRCRSHRYPGKFRAYARAGDSPNSGQAYRDGASR